jgi:hypothetical protein
LQVISLHGLRERPQAMFSYQPSSYHEAIAKLLIAGDDLSE